MSITGFVGSELREGWRGPQDVSSHYVYSACAAESFAAVSGLFFKASISSFSTFGDWTCGE